MDRYYRVKSTSFETINKEKIGKRKEKSKKKKKSKEKPGKAKLSILIATFWDYPHTGGLSNYITTLSNGLKKQGHKVDIVSPNQFSSAKVGELREAVVPELKTFFHNRYGTSNSKIIQSSRLLYIYEEMLKKMDLSKYDIFHAQDLFTANILGRFNESYGKPLFFTPHGMFTFSRLQFNRIEKGSIEEVYYTEMERKAIQFASHIIILSDSFREPLKKLGAIESKMTTVNTGIDFDDKAAKKGAKKSNSLVISTVARLGPRKGHKYLLDALNQVRKHIANAEVLIVGDGEMRTELEEQAKTLNLTNVKFLGTRDDVPKILGQTDIFVLPTINDNLPISIIEAMHSGTAIISTNCGGIPEIIKNYQTGIIVEPGDSKALATAIRYLLNNPTNREKIATNAYQYAKKHLTSDAMLLTIEDIYNRFLDREKG
ncbi:glycosyltransferase family 4 protein [Cytobacillus sp. FJAT-54145]|uniref:Glycosyltransferase family 4 protein n=1 Tax=Cytobacillus spartinae TaxID=3299023 RepID=A0ABW6K9Y0_9BACI